MPLLTPARGVHGAILPLLLRSLAPLGSRSTPRPNTAPPIRKLARPPWPGPSHLYSDSLAPALVCEPALLTARAGAISNVPPSLYWRPRVDYALTARLGTHGPPALPAAPVILDHVPDQVAVAGGAGFKADLGHR